MRVLVTGASGFVGSHLARVFAARGAEVIAPSHAELDLTDRAATLRAVDAAAPDAIVHAAILNDPVTMARDKRAAWDAYVGATRNLVDSGAHVVLISTDWVFDGTQGPAREDEPPNPINQYGFLKAASELLVAERGTVARIAAVQGTGRAPRGQDYGFGYLVASVVAALRVGEPFTVWESPAINMYATPTLACAGRRSRLSATDAAELIWRALARGATGVLHCCGGTEPTSSASTSEHVDRVTLARRAAAAFDLDPDRVLTGPPPEPPSAPLPYDTRLDASATAARLGVELPDLDAQLAQLRREMEAAWTTT